MIYSMDLEDGQNPTREIEVNIRISNGRSLIWTTGYRGDRRAEKSNLW